MLLTILEIGECVLVANKLHCVASARQPLYRIHVSPTGVAVDLQTDDMHIGLLATGATSAIEIYPDDGTTEHDVLASVPRILSSFKDALAKLELDWSSFTDQSPIAERRAIDRAPTGEPSFSDDPYSVRVDALGANLVDRLEQQDPLAAVAANLVLRSGRLGAPLAGRLRYQLEYAAMLPTKTARHASLLANDLVACFRAGLDGSSDAAKDLLTGGILVGPARTDLTRSLELHGDREVADRALDSLDFEDSSVTLVSLDDRGLNQLLSQSDVKSLGLTDGDSLWVSDLAGNAKMIEVCFNTTLKDLLWDTAAPRHLVLMPPRYNINVVQMIAKGVAARLKDRLKEPAVVTRLKDSLKTPAVATRLKDLLKAPAVAARLKARGLAPADPYKVAEIVQPVANLTNAKCLTIDLTLSSKGMGVLLPQHPVERLGLKPGDTIWIGLKCGAARPVLANVPVDFNLTLKDLVPDVGDASSVALMCGSISGSVANDVLYEARFSTQAISVLKSMEHMTLVDSLDPTVDVVKLWLADCDEGLLPQLPIHRLGVLPRQHVWLGWASEYRLVAVDFNATISELLKGDGPEGGLLVIFHGDIPGDVVAERLKDILATSDSHPRQPKADDAFAPVNEDYASDASELDDNSESLDYAADVIAPGAKPLEPTLAPPPLAAAEGWSAAVIVDREGDDIKISLRHDSDGDYAGDTIELDAKPIVSEWLTKDGEFEIPSSMQVDDDWVDPYEADLTPTPIPDVDVTALPVAFAALNAALSGGVSPSATLTTYAHGLVSDLLVDLRQEVAREGATDAGAAPERILSPAGTLDLAKVNDDPSPTVISVAGVKVYGCLTVIAKRKDLTTKATRVLLAMSLHRCEKYYGVIGIVIHESVSAIGLIDRLLAHPTNEDYITITTIDPAKGV